jgi:hypothetical protein
MSSFDPIAIRQAVAEFTPRRLEKFHNLAPAKDVIAELRQKRASYRAIADLLTKHCLPTSKTAVAAYCHRVLSETVRPYHRSGPRPAPAVAGDGKPARPPLPARPESTDENDNAAARTRGPRIAKVRLISPEDGK